MEKIILTRHQPDPAKSPGRFLMKLCAAISACIGVLAVLCAQAQTMALRGTVNGGGGTSGSGQYQISGTIGQPEASLAMTNGPFAVSGGFWAMPIAVQTHGAPFLTITVGGPGQATIAWPAEVPGYVLQETALLTPATWGNAPSGTNNPVTIPATSIQKYYRLFKP